MLCITKLLFATTLAMVSALVIERGHPHMPGMDWNVETNSWIPYPVVETNSWLEENSRHAVRKHLPADAKVLEIGARYGSVSCLIAEIQHESGQVVSAEPDQRVGNALEKNLKDYECNVNLLRGAVGTTPVTVFEADYGTSTVQAHLPPGMMLGEVHTHQAKAYPLAEIENTFKIKFDTLVVDCEGCFPTLLRESPQLVQQVKLIIVEAHDPDEEKTVSDLQSKSGFKLIDSFGRQRVLSRTK